MRVTEFGSVEKTWKYILEKRERGLNLEILVDLIKSLNGEFEPSELASQFSNFFFNKMILDITAIKDYLDVRPFGETVLDPKALFLSERKQRISKRTVQHIIKEYLKQISGAENLSTHKLRHTAATLMYQYGNVDIRALQEILGHESIATTEIYTHVDNSQIREAIENNPLANYK